MRAVRRALAALACIAALLAVSACGPNLRGTVDAERVGVVLERVAVPYAGRTPPAALVERLAAFDVVVVGEHHAISEHGRAVADLVAALHPNGLRALLVEYPQATSWLLDGYARGMLDALDGAARATYGELLDALRSFNLGLEPAQRVRVYAIDVNHRPEDALAPLRGLMHQLAFPDVLVDAVDALERGEDAEAVFARLAAALTADAAVLETAWGEPRYRIVVDLVDAERRSLPVRAIGNERQRSNERERVMHELVERYRERHDGPTLVNVGAYHAQRTSRDGTVEVWLAERLGDDAYSLLVTPTRGELPRGDTIRNIDVLEDSPSNELLRLTVERHGHALVYVPLDDPLFHDERVVLTHHSRLDTEPPGRVFDGVLLLGEVRAIRR